MGPVSQPDRHDLPRLINEAVPRLAAMIDEIVVGEKDAVRQPIVAQELPDILDGVQLGALGWERHDRDGRGHDKVARQMPSGLVEEKDRVLARRDLARDFGEVQGHRLGIAAGQDECCALAVVRADRSEDVGGGGALIVRGAGSCPASGPAPRDLVLLADPGLVSEPEF